MMWISDRGQDPDFPALIDPNNAAIIVIDVQNDFCHPDGAFGRVGHDTSLMPDLAASLRKLLAEARARQVLTIFVRATYDREVTSPPLAQHRRRLGLLESLCLEGTWGADWFGGVTPIGAPNEVVLSKHRFDAFQGTPLDLYLRSNRIRTVIVTGVATSGCVESTVRDAFFLDYRVVVPHDGVGEPSRDYHEAALIVMKRSFATVTAIDDIVTTWQQSNVPIEPSWRPDVRRTRMVRDRESEGLVLVDVDRLNRAQAAAAEKLARSARESGVPIFDVRSLDITVGLSPWIDSDRIHQQITDTTQPNPLSSPAYMHIGKMRRSAFADTRLRLLLRTNEIRSVTIAGADASHGALAATVLDALDFDFVVSVAVDACAEVGWGELQRAGVLLQETANVATRWASRPPHAALQMTSLESQMRILRSRHESVYR
jgi:ureidoacrylate peracid hydrolase